MICLPGGYQKYDLPLNNEPVRVFIEVHIKDIPKVHYFLTKLLLTRLERESQIFFQVSDQDFSITLDAYFNVKWQDPRLVSSLFQNNNTGSTVRDKFTMTAVNVNILPKLWIPDLEIMDLMSFETHKILSRLEGEYLNLSYGP